MSQYHLLNQHNEGYYDDDHDDDDDDEEDNQTAAASNHKTVSPKKHMLATLPNNYFDDNYYHLNDEMKLPNDLQEYKKSFKVTQVDLSPFIHNPNNSKTKIYYNNNNNKSNNINMYNNNNCNNNNNKTMHISYEHSTSNNSFVNILDSDESSALDVPLLNYNQQQQQQHNQHNQPIDHNNVENHSSNNNNNNNNNNINNSKRHGNNTNYNEDIPQEWLHYPCRQQGFSHDLCYKSTQIAKSKILAAIVVCCLFMIVEFLGGYIAGSLAIMSDAAHLASDCISFVIGLLAIWLGSRPPDDKMSFGYKRIEVMGALASILGIWLLTATLVYAALQRLYNQDFTLDANAMLIVSAVGILINIIMILILHTPNCILPTGQLLGASHHSHSHNHSHQHRSSYAKAPASPLANQQELPKESLIGNRNSLKHDTVGTVNNNLNLRAAMIHVIGDLVQSFGVFFASVLIKFYPKAGFLDPLCTLLFSIIVVLTTVHLFKESFLILIDSVPHNLCLKDLRNDFLNIEGVNSVHHLNVWHHTVNFKVLTVHLVIDSLAENELVLQKATQLVQSSKYNIKHCTIQIERL